MSRTVTLQGNPLNLEGPELAVGESAPDATVSKGLGQPVSLNEFAGKKARIYSVVPSLDTPVCADQTRRFNEAAVNLPNVDFYTVSVDLPPAQARFCGAEGIDKSRFKVLSDHQSLEFGKNYGTLVPDLRILCRAVFVVGADDELKYVEYVPEVAEHPNYDAVIECAKTQ